MEKIYENRKTISESRLIAGYLREAVFHRSQFSIRQEHAVFNARLVDIVESAARDRNSERLLIFEIQATPGLSEIFSSEAIGDLFEISVPLERLLFRFITKFISLEAGRLCFALPLEAVIISSRQDYRFRADHLSPRCCTVKISEKNDLLQFGMFEISDLSADGVGGTLTVSKSRAVHLGARVQGRLTQQCGAIQIDGAISWVDKADPGMESIYRVGIRNFSPNEPLKTGVELSERRARVRLRAQLLVEAISPLFPNATAVLRLEDLSLLGMRARFINFADAVLFRPGLELVLTDPKLRLRVLYVTKKHVTFEILRSAIEEHIKLFNLQSFLSEDDLALNTPVSSDISQVYSTSGAFSTSLARNLSVQKQHLLDANAENSGKFPWFLRWLQQSQDGRIKATILTAPFSDHVWYLGGLAGHLNEDLRMGNDFVGRYFRALQGFLNSLGSKEYLFFNWFETNSWWTEWDAHLNTCVERPDFFRFQGEIVYLKDPSKILTSSRDEADWELIEQGDILKVEEVLNLIQPLSIRRLFAAFGLNSFTFGATSVGELIRRAGYDFFRKFFRIKIGDAVIVVMLSSFPSYTFINGIINYPFVYSPIPLNPRELDWLTGKLCGLCCQFGIEMPAFFITTGSGKHGFSETEVQQLRVIKWTFSTPDVLDFWSKP